MGRNGAGKTTLLKMVAGALAPDAGDVTLGASLKMGYFAQQALDLLDPDLTVWEQIERDFPHESIGVLRNLLGAFQFSGDEIDKKIRVAVGRREDAAGDRAHAARSAELPRARRADQPSRSGDQGHADPSAVAIRGHDDVRVARPRVPARARATACSSSAARAAPSAAARLSRLLHRVRRSAPATKRRACTTEAGHRGLRDPSGRGAGMAGSCS